MKIHLNRSTTPFNLEYTLGCGQVFRWRRVADHWYGVINENVVKIRQIDDKLLFQTYPEHLGINFVESYFRLDDNLPQILFQISKDENICTVIRNLYGLRIIRQEPWECLISYMCATNTNVSAIKKMIQNLCKVFGRRFTFDGYDFYTFPKPKDLAGANLEEIMGCKLGFRAKRIIEASKIIANKDFILEAVKKMDYERAKQTLMALPGIGQKVADCILLFSLDMLGAFPVDVWIKRIILKLYPKCFAKSFIEKALTRSSITPQQYTKISSFGRDYFGEYAGYAQEYLYALRMLDDFY